MFHRRRFGGHHKQPSTTGTHASLFLMSAMILFWTLSEGIISFIAPLRIEEAGFSDTMMGVILGTSSVAGALFDFVAVRLFPNTYYKRIFGIMFALCLTLPLILMQEATPLLFMFGMIIWGIYYDLRNIGSFDYIARTTQKENNAHSMGIIQVFASIGWIIGPLIVGFLVGDSVGWEPFLAIYIFLAIAFFFYIALCFATGSIKEQVARTEEHVCRRGTWSEIRMLGDVGRALFPALIVIFFLNFADAFFWSIGPLFAEHIGLGTLAGVLMAAWSLPSLLLGWHAGKVAAHIGKERTAYIAQFLGGLCLIPLFFISSGIGVVVTAFVAASFMAIAWPAIQGAFADYIAERPELDKEIEGLEDLYTNFGYVIGPITAGFISDQLGYNATFGFLGITVATATLLLILFAKKRIHLTKKGPPLICDVA